MPPKKQVRQRLGLDKKSEVPQSAVGDFCQSMARSGRLTAGEVCQAAAAASSSMAASSGASSSAAALGPDVTRLASISKRSRAHASRDLWLTYSRQSALPPLYSAQVTTWDHKNLQPKPSTMQVLPIHELLDHLVQEGEAATWCQAKPNQQGFLTELHAWGARMGVDTSSNHWCPIGLWGDSAPSFKKDSVFLLTWRALLGNIPTRYWFATFSKRNICKCGCKGRHTLNDLFEVVAWSMRALLTGEYPRVDHAHQPFPRGTFRGDLAGTPLKVHGAVLAKAWGLGLVQTGIEPQVLER